MIKHRTLSVSLVVLMSIGLMLAACGSPAPTPLPAPATAEPTQAPSETPVPTSEPTATPTLPPTAKPAPTATIAPTPVPTSVPTQTIYALLKSAPQFSTLVAAIDQAGLTQTLELPGPFTVFAPNDAAFKTLPQDQIDALLKNDTLLQEVLMYHVVPGRYAAASLGSVQALTTALTSTVLTMAGSGISVTVNAAAIVSPDMAASNGLVHEIANVLIPTQISAAAPSPSGTSLITGTVAYLPRIALDPKAVIEVQLQDVSLADAPAKTIASQSIDAQGRQVPIAFELAYDPAVINAKNRYALAVRILVAGQLRFINTTSIPVLTNGARSTNVEVLVDPVSDVASADAVTPTLSVLTGTLTFTASAALPAGAVLDVTLNDTTIVTAPVIVAAAQSVVAKPSGALPYTIHYDPALIDPKRIYALGARLLIDGRVVYANSDNIAVLTFGKPATGIALPVTAVKDAQPAADLVTITGTLDIDAAALNPAAIIEVQLQDVSRTDAAAEVISVQVITAVQTSAIPFALYYNPYAIDPAHHYQLNARVTVSAEVQYASTEPYPVLTAGQLTGVAMTAEALSVAAVTPTATPAPAAPTPTPAPVAGSGVLTGAITAAQTITLPANAEIVVKLLDVSRMDAPSQVVAEQTLAVDGRQLPIPFTLNYDTAQIDATHYYMLLATISVNGELGWFNPQAIWALTYGNAAGNISVPVQPVP